MTGTLQELFGGQPAGHFTAGMRADCGVRDDPVGRSVLRLRRQPLVGPAARGAPGSVATVPPGRHPDPSPCHDGRARQDVLRAQRCRDVSSTFTSRSPALGRAAGELSSHAPGQGKPRPSPTQAPLRTTRRSANVWGHSSSPRPLQMPARSRLPALDMGTGRRPAIAHLKVSFSQQLT